MMVTRSNPRRSKEVFSRGGVGKTFLGAEFVTYLLGVNPTNLVFTRFLIIAINLECLLHLKTLVFTMKCPSLTVKSLVGLALDCSFADKNGC